jgi:GGDEF domain-containing protein
VLLQERLEELLAAQIPLSVVFCDLDQFKRINDTHGHAVGDGVLRAMGARLARRLAAADVVARIGGDECVVCEPGGTGVRPGSAAERAEELLSNADREMYAHKRSRAGAHRLEQLAANQPRTPPDLP